MFDKNFLTKEEQAGVLMAYTMLAQELAETRQAMYNLFIGDN